MNVEDQLRFIEARRYISSPRGLERTTDHNAEGKRAGAWIRKDLTLSSVETRISTTNIFVKFNVSIKD